MKKQSKPEAGLRAAHHLIARHGLRAAAVAAEHAAQYSAQGNLDAAQDWRAISHAVTEIRASSRIPHPNR